MDYFERTKIEFTAYMKAVVKNASADYKRKLLKRLEHEISVADFTCLPQELLSFDSGSFLLENDITYANIENVFTDEKYYRAMKKLTDREKLVIHLTVVEGQSVVAVAEIMNTTKENIWQIKSRAIRNFLKNVTAGK
jgi:RNA polymerase sigma factor (sigma-70 family)